MNASAVHPEVLADSRILGDFRILRELGRGGMGIVYEAEQVSMGRKVALKILPMAAVLDPRHVRRFKNEVQAAALLQHQNIVPVYSVGCERGVHYYAMQYVEGHTLAEVIASLRSLRGDASAVEPHRGDQPQTRQTETAAALSHVLEGSRETDDARRTNGKPPSSPDRPEAGVAVDVLSSAGSTTSSAGVRNRCRAAARLIIQAAEALDHAHQRGVLHRDIKPANLMVDATGNLWVTDFGLARLEADVGTTTIGQIVGTLRYMSPEQALAKRTIVDQRTDIYSLSATLYELCALQPAFVADDRQELLRQIAFEEPRPLRKIDPAIPRELETIAQKAMEKHPADRYETAQEMADDLRRYLDDRPILARPPSVRDRVRKWGVRNRKTTIVAAAAAVVGLMASLGAFAFHSSQLSSANQSQALNSELVASRDETNELLYRADMRLAFKAWDRRHLDELQTLLDRHKPKAGETDVRGIEWDLLSSLAIPPQPVVFLEHDIPVRELAVVPGKDEFVSVGEDGTIRHWSISPPRPLRTIETGAEQLHAVAISPDGKWLATGNPTLELWDFAKGTKVRDLSWQDCTLESVTFAPDSESIAAAWRHDEVRIIALDGEERARLPVGKRNETLVFSQDGERLFVPVPTDNGCAIRQWHVHSPSEWSDLGKGDPSPGWSRLAVSHDDRVSAVVTYMGGTVHVIENATDQQIGTLGYAADVIRALDFAPHSDRLAWGCDDGSLHTAVMPRGWQFYTPSATLQQTVPRTMAAHTRKITDVEYLNGERVLTCSEDGSIKLWNMLETEVAAPLELPGDALSGIEFAPDDGQMAVPCADGSVWLGRASDGRTLDFVKIGDRALEKLAFSPEGSRIFAGDNDGSVVAWDRRERRVLTEWHNPKPARVLALAVAPRGERIATAAADQLVRIHDADSLSVVETIAAPANVAALDFSPDGRMLAWGGGFNEVFLHETRDWTLKRRIPTRSACSCIAFANAQGLLASGHQNGAIQIIDARGGHVLQRFPSGAGVQSLAWAPDDQLLVSTHSNGTQRVWHVPSSTELGVLHRGGMTNAAVRFSPDGSRLAAVLFQDEASQGILWKLRD